MSRQYDPYENVVAVMEEAMNIGGIDKRMFEIIKNPQRETKVYLPVEMDDGSVKPASSYLYNRLPCKRFLLPLPC